MYVCCCFWVALNPGGPCQDVLSAEEEVDKATTLHFRAPELADLHQVPPCARSSCSLQSSAVVFWAAFPSSPCVGRLLRLRTCGGIGRAGLCVRAVGCGVLLACVALLLTDAWCCPALRPRAGERSSLLAYPMRVCVHVCVCLRAPVCARLCVCVHTGACPCACAWLCCVCVLVLRVCPCVPVLRACM
jgi:hypothetical protein